MWVIYFESFKEIKLVNSVLYKGNLSLTYKQETAKPFFVFIINRCLRSLQMYFRFFVKVFLRLVSSPNTQKEKNLTGINMWFDN